MKNNAIKWLYAVPKRKKLYILALMLVQALNGARKLTDEDKEMLSYIVFSGTYGTLENSINNKVAKYGSGKLAKIKYVFGRLTVPTKESDPQEYGRIKNTA